MLLTEMVRLTAARHLYSFRVKKEVDTLQDS